MTVEEFKAKNPQAYEALVNEGFAEGKNKGKIEERERVTAWLDYHNGDLDAAIEGIKEEKDVDFLDALKEDAKILKEDIKFS